MDLSELTRQMDAFVRARGWYDPESPRPQTARNLAVSLCLEAAEVLEHFQWGEDAHPPEELAHELADVALYLLQLAQVCDIDLEAAIQEKLSRNRLRTWEDPR